MSQTEIQGTVDPRFAAVRDAFAQNFTNGDQYVYDKTNLLAVRAVRKLPL
jgi:hypothetical protein